jgi:glycosyltransferase involved in cell wall biosynthesis
MRVLHVTPYFAPAFNYGGPPRSILGLCKALLKIGVDVEVFTTTANGAFDLPASSGSADSYEGVSVRYFPRAFPRRLFGAAGLARFLSSVAGRYDLVHMHGLWNVPSWIGSQAARKGGAPYVISPRGMLEPAARNHNPWRKRLAYLLYDRVNLANAAFLHATSAAEEQTIKRYGFEGEVVVLPNGVDVYDEGTGARGAFRRAHGLDENARLIVFLGRIHPIKRLDLLARAFGQIHRAIPNAHLIIAGPDECELRKTLEPMFKPFGDAVHWIGEVGEAEKWSLLKDADLLAMCSDSENFGVSVVEAMATGVPVVVTRTCPWQKVASAGCGFWVEQECHEIANAMEYVLTHPAEAAAMGERGRRLAYTDYGWGSIARGMADRYAAAIRSRPCVAWREVSA